jgi:hypothetical protein
MVLLVVAGAAVRGEHPGHRESLPFVSLVRG